MSTKVCRGRVTFYWVFPEREQRPLKASKITSTPPKMHQNPEMTLKISNWKASGASHLKTKMAGGKVLGTLKMTDHYAT